MQSAVVRAASAALSARVRASSSALQLVRCSSGYAHHNDKDKPMNEEWEIEGGWNDVQMIVDKDPFVSGREAAAGVFGFLALCGSVMFAASKFVPEKEAGKRVLPYDNAHAALGGKQL